MPKLENLDRLTEAIRKTHDAVDQVESQLAELDGGPYELTIADSVIVTRYAVLDSDGDAVSKGTLVSGSSPDYGSLGLLVKGIEVLK